MERTGLYRKLVKFIRSDLPAFSSVTSVYNELRNYLTENELSIAEIAERTGFSIPSGKKPVFMFPLNIRCICKQIKGQGIAVRIPAHADIAPEHTSLAFDYPA